jgi:hypothetical protein
LPVTFVIPESSFGSWPTPSGVIPIPVGSRTALGLITSVAPA